MSEIVFDTDKKNEVEPRRRLVRTSVLSKWLIEVSGGSIKNERQALVLIIGFIILVNVISAYIITGGQFQQQPDTASLVDWDEVRQETEAAMAAQNL